MPVAVRRLFGQQQPKSRFSSVRLQWTQAEQPSATRAPDECVFYFAGWGDCIINVAGRAFKKSCRQIEREKEQASERHAIESNAPPPPLLLRYINLALVCMWTGCAAALKKFNALSPSPYNRQPLYHVGHWGAKTLAFKKWMLTFSTSVVADRFSFQPSMP